MTKTSLEIFAVIGALALAHGLSLWLSAFVVNFGIIKGTVPTTVHIVVTLRALFS